MESKSFFTIAAIIGGQQEEIIKTNDSALARATFQQEFKDLQETEDHFILTLNLVYQAIDENGKQLSLREQELERKEWIYTNTYSPAE